MRRKLRKLSCGAAALIFVASVSADVAAALTTSPRDEPAVAGREVAAVLTPLEARQQEAAVIAAQMGWTVAEAMDNVRQHDRFGMVMAALSKRYPESFAGGWGTNETAKPKFVIRFTGSVPNDVLALAATHKVTVEFRGHARQSQLQMEARARTVAADVRRSGYAKVVAAPWVQQEKIRISVVRPASKSKAEVLRDLKGAVESPDLEVAVLEPSDVRVEEITYGGGSMFRGSTFLCTSGFVVRNAATIGVTTAGHCTNPDTYLDGNGSAFGTVEQGSHQGVFGDVEWHHTVGSATVREFYTSPSGVREVHRVEPEGEVTVGEWVCVFGRMTGALRCDTVQHPNHPCTDDAGRVMQNMVVMNNHITQGGDSGAPWHLSNTAFGGHFGRCRELGFASSFTKADRFDHAIGAEVLSRDRWVRGEAGQSQIVSPDSRFTFVMQGDGNLVLYQAGVGAIWASTWYGVPAFGGNWFAMQGDGNFVIYAPWGQPLWSTSSPGRDGAQMLVQSDGNVVLYDVDRNAIWASGTGGR